MYVLALALFLCADGTADQEARAFGRFMVGLEEKHRLPSFSRYDTKHFVALSNADDKFTEGWLRNCELLYALFFDHFRRKGFPVRDVPAKLMVAMFNDAAGFDAYVGQKMPALTTGLYHPATNRLVLYDYGANELLQARRRGIEREVRQIGSQMERERVQGAVQRWASDVRADTNTATIMHEVAHHLSFNCGLLRRDGDVPLWLAEGLACYCEATKDGSWQGLGALNENRVKILAQESTLATPRTLVEWQVVKGDGKTVLRLYAQSWALFRLLMEERPAALRRYLDLVRERKTPDHRLTDFRAAFGADLGELEKPYLAYVNRLVSQNAAKNRK